MASFEIHSRVTRRSLMNKSKDELSAQVMELLCELDPERTRHAADAKALREVIQHLHPGAAIVRIDEPTTGRHRYELFTNLSAQPPAHAGFVSKVYGVPWTEEPKPTRDADLPATGSFYG